MTGGHDPALRDLARQVLEWEGGGSQNAAELADAAERVCEKLSRVTGRLLSDTGFRMVLARAVAMTAAAFPDLPRVAANADDCLHGMRQAVLARSSAESAEVWLAVFAGFLEILASLIGNHLVLLLVEDAWPDLLGRDTRPREKEVGS